jgi:hypothetical protein
VAAAQGLSSLSSLLSKGSSQAWSKLKALGVYPSKVKSDEYEEEHAYYVQIYMEAAGYELHCGDPTSRWTDDT